MKKLTLIVLTMQNYGLFNTPANTFNETPLYFSESSGLAPYTIETKREFDELIQEKRGTTYWLHFAVRPMDNRRKILFDCR